MPQVLRPALTALAAEDIEIIDTVLVEELHQSITVLSGSTTGRPRVRSSASWGNPTGCWPSGHTFTNQRWSAIRASVANLRNQAPAR